MGKNKHDLTIFKQTQQNIFASVAKLYMIWMMLIFPLFMLPVWEDERKKKLAGGYYTILVDKYLAYVIIAGIALGVAFLLGLIFVFVDRVEFKGQWVRTSLDRCKAACRGWRHWIPEWSVLMFLAVCTISTVVSQFKFESFWGNEGRKIGLFVLALMVGTFFLIRCCLQSGKCYLNLFLISMFFAEVMGILQYLGFDCFQLRYYTINPTIFVSTFGNINIYTSIVAMSMAAAAVLYMSERQMLLRILYYISYFVSSIAIIMGNSDNAYLSIGVLFAGLPLLFWKDRHGVSRYLMLAAGFLLSIKMIFIVNTRYPDHIDGVEGIFDAIAPNGIVWLLIVCLGLTAVWIARAGGRLGDAGFRRLRIGWLVFLLSSCSVVCFVLYDVNIRGNEAPYGALLGYLKFDDEWGTHRGFIWRAMMGCYQEFPPLQKMFGFGPDTTGIFYRFSDFRPISLERYGEYIDAAHNEYLQYLVTIGPLGLLSYLMFIGSSGFRMVGRGMKRLATGDGQVLAVFFAALCYLTQAVVNISSPVNTPILWCLLALGLVLARGEDQSIAV